MHNHNTDDQFYAKLQQEHGPIFKLFWGSRTLKICLVGFDRGRRLLVQQKGHLQPSLTPPNDISSMVRHGYLRVMHGETHSEYRRVFVHALSDDLIDGWSDSFRATIRLHLNRLAALDIQNTTADRLVEALNQISTRTLLSLVFGVQSMDEAADDLYEQYCKLGPNGYIESVRKKRQAQAFNNIRQKILKIHLALRDGASNDYTDCVLKRLLLANREAGIDETLIGNAIHMVERGRHDVRDLLRWTIKHLSDNPSVIAELRDSGENNGGSQSLAQACILETLRLEQAEVINRKVTKAFDFEGFHFPKNTRASILIRESHRDSSVFDAPDSYQPQRFLDNTFSANAYSPFGLDAHQCIGSSYVIKLGGHFVDELVTGFRWQVIGDGPRQWGHFHWQPSQSFAIKLTGN